jgi:FkbM family methyltransferase
MSKQADKKEWARLLELLGSPLCRNRLRGIPEVVLYGAGIRGREAYQQLLAKGIRVRCFLDRKAVAIGRIGNIPCLRVTSRPARMLAQQGIPAVLAVFNYQTNLEPLIRKLRAVGFQTICTYGELHEILSIPSVFWMGSRKNVQKNKKRILQAFHLLNDKKSRTVFCDHIGLRLRFESGSLARPSRGDQYAPSDLSFPNPRRFVDGGAFDGDTTGFFLRKKSALEAVAAFEPDLFNFRKLTRSLSFQRRNIQEIVLIPAGLGEKTASVKFLSGFGAGSRFIQGEGLEAPIVALDDVLPNFSPTLIKLDIEGLEPAALRGAKKLISSTRPDLAICVYHQPEHLWEIPLLLKTMVPQYRFWMRCHGYNGFDLVLYASIR